MSKKQKLILILFFLLVSCANNTEDLDEATDNSSTIETVETEEENEQNNRNPCILVLTEIRIRNDASVSTIEWE